MVTLCILDGWGESKQKFGNAIYAAGTPNIDKLKEKYTHSLLQASGKAVGLSEGQMGNSEVGHLNLGAGRVVLQDLERINDALQKGTFETNETLIKAINYAEKNNSALHLMGLVSDGGVHSHINHLIKLLEMANKSKVQEIYVHFFGDGRDTPPKSALTYAKQLKNHLGRARIATICGRVWAMDREKRFERIEKAYNMLVLGQADNYYQTIEDAINDSYSKNITDEFIQPSIIGKPAKISSFDSVVFFNFRTDRSREITEALTQKGFDKFETARIHDLCFTCFTEYDATFKNVQIVFPPEKIENNLAKILADNKIRQFHIAETTKYAHVTFFFNGGIEQPYKGETRELIDSIDTTDFSTVPKMRAYEIADKTTKAIASGKYDFVLVNFSNPDMIGHTGNFEATKEAIQTVDRCAYFVALSTLMAGGECIITADHGNAELMMNLKEEPITSHTTNPVPVIIVSNKKRNIKLKNGKLANIAPTILKMFKIDIPKDMEAPLF